jgi:murein DD-endopeptidase MepM/ murein hydrolase activator NlpD
VFQEFGNRNVRYDLQYHVGEDANGNSGTPVRAIADGTIAYSGPGGGYGWVITVDHPTAKVYSLYGHLSAIKDRMAQGKVTKGQIIGYLADNVEDGSGGSYPDWGPHLHFAIRKGRTYDYPDTGDVRWAAGYTPVYPADLGWLDPTDFIEQHSRSRMQTVIGSIVEWLRHLSARGTKQIYKNAMYLVWSTGTWR